MLQKDDFHLHMVSELLGIDKGQLQKWLCNRKIVATGEVYIVPLNLREVSVFFYCHFTSVDLGRTVDMHLLSPSRNVCVIMYFDEII